MPSKEGDSITDTTGINVLEVSPTGCHNLQDTTGATGISILQSDSSTENRKSQDSPTGTTRLSILQRKSAGRDSSTGSANRRRHSWQDGAAGGNVPQEGREAGAGGKALIHPQRHNLKHRFELLRTLGEGTYGKVKLACERSTGEQVAIKYVKKTKIRDDNDLARIRREIRILSSLTHQHIVNIRQVYEKKDRIVLVMDCAPGGELYEYLNTHRCLPETQTRRFFRQIVGAVHYIHQNGIVHRDLKLENIVLDQEGDVKIADFGLANYFTLNSTLNTFCGSPLYASPEIVNGKAYHGPEVDVWSLGVVLYTLSYGAMPFESSNLKVLRQQISSGHYAEPAQPCGAASLIRHMLTVNPTRRATLPDILGHWWVNLGHDVTPDGREYRPLTQSLHKVTHESDLDLLSRPPPPGLHRVPGARSGRKSVDIALDDDELLRHIGQFSSSSRSLRRGPPCPDASDGGIFPWRHTIASGAVDIPTRVTDSSAIPKQSERPATEKQPKVAPDQSHDGQNLKSKPGPENEENEVKLIEITSETVPGCKDNDTKPPMPDTPSSHQESQDSGLAHSEEASTMNGGKTVGVFDSDRKPKRSILKRKGKFSGDYSSYCIPTDDAALRAGEEEDCPLCRSLPCDSNFLPSAMSSHNHSKRHQSVDSPVFTEDIQLSDGLAQPSSPRRESLVTPQVTGENMLQFTPCVVPCPMHSGWPPVGGTAAVSPQPLPTQPSAVSQFSPLSTAKTALSESHVLSSQHAFDFQSHSLSSERPTLPQAVLLPTEHNTVSQPLPLSADQRPNGHSHLAPLGAPNHDSHGQPHPQSKVTLHNTLTPSPLDENLGAMPDSDGALVVDSSGSLNTTASDKCLPLDNQYAGEDAAAPHVAGDLSASIIPSAVCTCPVNADVSKVVRRPKGILKNSNTNTSATANSGNSNTTTNSHNNNSRNSGLEDPRKRFSMGSLSSSSSADILDLSYDSGDCDQLGGRCYVAAVPGIQDYSAWDGNSTLTDASVNTEAGNNDLDSVSKQAGDQDCFMLDTDFSMATGTGVSLQNREQDSFTSEKVITITSGPSSYSSVQGRPQDSHCVEGQFRAVPLISISSIGDLPVDVGEDNDVGVGEREDDEEGLHCNQQPIFQDNVFDFTEARQVLQKALNFLN